MAFCHHCIGVVTAASVRKLEWRTHNTKTLLIIIKALLCSASSKEVINLYVNFYRVEQTAIKTKLSSKRFLPLANATVREAYLFKLIWDAFRCLTFLKTNV